MSTQPKPDQVATALFGKTRRLVLALFYSHAEESFYLREVVRRTGAGLGAVQRELKRLTSAGILLRSIRGNQVYYQAHRQCPVFADLEGLIIKTAGVADVLRAALTVVADRIEVAFLYGSLAKGTAKADSDVDVLVVGEADFADIVVALGEAQEVLNREVNPSVYPAAEFCRKLAQRHHFLTTVLEEPKVFLLGGEDELARLAESRLANGPFEQPARNRRFTRSRRS
jgi:predicted nucleotidyltransferase